MKIAMAIRPLDFEGLGTLEQLLTSRGYAMRYLRSARYSTALLAVHLLVLHDS